MERIDLKRKRGLGKDSRAADLDNEHRLKDHYFRPHLAADARAISSRCVAVQYLDALTFEREYTRVFQCICKADFTANMSSTEGSISSTSAFSSSSIVYVRIGMSRVS